MARPKTPEGKRVTISAKFSEAQASEIDAARGSADRSEWLRLAALAAAERQRPPARQSREDTAPPVSFVAADPAQPQPAGKVKNAPMGRTEPESASDIMAALRRRRNGEQP